MSDAAWELYDRLVARKRRRTVRRKPILKAASIDPARYIEHHRSCPACSCDYGVDDEAGKP